MRAMAVALALTLVLAAGPAYSQAFDERTIRPGEALGPFRLGMSLQQAAGILGRPPDAEATEGALKVSRWNLQGDHSGLTASPYLSIGVNGAGVVETITTTSSTFATARGAGVGLGLTAFKEEVQTPYRGYKDGSGVRHLRFDTAGLALTYEIRSAGGTTVKSVSIFAPAASMGGPGPTILPGVGVGPVRLGMSAAEVIRAMGQAPARRDRTASGGEFLIFVLREQDPFGDNAWLTVSVDPGRGAMLITTDAVAHQTAQGSTPGVGILELQAEFGVQFRPQALVISGVGSLMGVWYYQYGIAGFYFPPDTEKRILWVGVFKIG